MPQKLLDCAAAAEYLGLSPGTIRNWTSCKKIPHMKISGAVRYGQADLDRWLETNRVPVVEL